MPGSGPTGYPAGGAGYAASLVPIWATVILCPLPVLSVRYTSPSWAIRSGASVKAVQGMLGHASAVITLEVCAHLFDDELDSVADRIGEMFDLHRTSTEYAVAV